MQISKSQNSLSFESQIVDGLHYRLLDVGGQGLGLVESEYSVATFQYSLRSPLHEQDKFVFDLVNRHLILVGRVERNFTNLRDKSRSRSFTFLRQEWYLRMVASLVSYITVEHLHTFEQSGLAGVPDGLSVVQIQMVLTDDESGSAAQNRHLTESLKRFAFPIQRLPVDHHVVRLVVKVQVDHFHLVLGESSSFVRADDAGATESLDGFEFLDHAVLGGHSLRGESHAGCESDRESLRDVGNDQRYEVGETGEEVVAVGHADYEEEGANGDGQDRDELDEVVDFSVDRSFTLLQSCGQPRDGADQGVVAPLDDDPAPCSLHHASAEERHVWSLQSDGVGLVRGTSLREGLPRDGAVVHFESLAVDQSHICRYPLSCLQVDHVPEDHLFARDHHRHVVPYHDGRLGGELLEACDDGHVGRFLVETEEASEEDHDYDHGCWNCTRGRGYARCPPCVVLLPKYSCSSAFGLPWEYDMAKITHAIITASHKRVLKPQNKKLAKSNHFDLTGGAARQFGPSRRRRSLASSCLSPLWRSVLYLGAVASVTEGVGVDLTFLLVRVRLLNGHRWCIRFCTLRVASQ
jgi:hypothetical protein